MVRHKHPLNLVLIAVTISLTCAQAAVATKMNAKPLPRNGDPGGQAKYDRGDKDFENDAQYNAPVSSRFKRREDYRDIEKRKAEEEEQKKKDAIEAQKQAELARAQGEKKRAAEFQKYKTDAIEFNNQGVALGSQGRWVEAITMHEKAVQYDRSNKQYSLNLSAARTAFGEKKMKDGDFSGAAALYRKALAAASDNAKAAKGLSSALEKCGYDPVNADARLTLGDQLINTGDLEGAYIEYKQAMEIDPSAKAYVKLGDLQYRCGQAAAAMQCYQQAAVKDPTYGPAQRQLGIMKLLSKDETGAAALFRKAVILDDTDALAGQQLVDIWRRQVAKNPLSPDYHLGFAGALQLTGDYAGAEAEYKKLEMLSANHPGLAEGRASLQKAYHHGRAEKHKKAAETLYSQGLRKEALAEVSQAVMIEPRNAKYQFLLGECLEAIGDYKAAHQAYLTCVLIDPETEKGREAASRMKEMQQNAPAGATPPQQPQQSYQQRPGMMQQRMMPQGMPPQGMPQQAMPMRPNFQGQGQPMMGGMPPASMPANMMSQAPQTMPQGGMRFPAYPPQAQQQNPWPQQKGVYEGAPAGMSAPPTAMGFRQQDLSQTQVSAPAQNPVAMGANTGTRNFPQGAAGTTIYGGAPANDNVNVPTGTPETQGSATQDPKLIEVTQAESRKDHMAAVAILRELVAKDLENASIHHRLAVNLMASGRISEAVTEFRIASALKPGFKTYADDLAQALAIHKRSMMSNKNGTTTNTEEGGNQ